MDLYTFIVLFTFLSIFFVLFIFIWEEKNEVIFSNFQHIFWCKSCNKFEAGTFANEEILCQACGQKCTLIKF